MARTETRSSSAGPRVRPWGPRIGLALLVVGITVAPVPGRTAKAAVIPHIAVTARSGFSATEVNFLNYLEAADFELIKAEPDQMLYAVGQDSCAQFVKGDTEAQVFQTEKAAVARKQVRMSAAQIGALLPVAVLKLCPAFLSTVTISVD